MLESNPYFGLYIPLGLPEYFSLLTHPADPVIQCSASARNSGTAEKIRFNLDASGRELDTYLTDGFLKFVRDMVLPSNHFISQLYSKFAFSGRKRPVPRVPGSPIQDHSIRARRFLQYFWKPVCRLSAC
jgi:hypothetical protein